MILSKDLQEILEGVHYFLSETLSSEPLAGKVECLRRGLVLQLEALALSYPTLRIRARSSVSLPYLAMDQGPNQLAHRLSESLSSGSSGTNSYSNNSSGDGLVMGSGRGVCADQPQIQQQQQLLSPDSQSTLDEEYEDFQDNNETKSVSDSNGILKDVDMTQDDLDDNDDVYADSLEAVSFSSIIATCDKHGVLAKKTKGLLRNMKNYQCVAANGLLYLFLKETDERQRKTIDLSGYTARISSGEDIRDQRKRDSAFEIVGPGKKTHTFIARTARDRVEWLAALGRTIKGGRSRTLPTSLSGVFSNFSSETNKLILPHKGAPILPVSQKLNDANKEEDFYYHDVANDEKDDVYEVVGPEGTVFGKPVGIPEVMSSRPAPNPPQQNTDLEDYDPVSPDDVPPPLPNYPPPPAPNFGRCPPERPPLPANFQDKVNKQASRPLPDAPQDANYNLHDPGGIYCEIEEDFSENESEDVAPPPSDEYKNFSGDTTYINRNNVSQECKKPRAVSADGLPRDSGSMSPALSSRTSASSLVGSFSDEIFMNMNISDPNISQHTPHKYSIRSTHKTPPKLPPKGVPLPPVEDDDSEYKVPPSAIMDAEYQIPPNPVPTAPENVSQEASIAGSEMYQVPSSQTPVAVKPETSEKPQLLSMNGKVDTQPKSNLKALTKQFEKRESAICKDFKDGKLPNQGTSVKDMIARLNKNKTVTENAKVSKPKDSVVSVNNSSSDQVDGAAVELKTSDASNTADSKMIKPHLPPRPQNLLAKTLVTNKTSVNQEEEKSNIEEEKSDVEKTNIESDDDYYETPEGNSFDSTSQQDIDGTLSKNITVPLQTKRESTTEASVATEKGEWYVAKFAFVATTNQALSFSRGDLIFVHENMGPSGWWKATVKGKSGVVPREYLKKKES